MKIIPIVVAAALCSCAQAQHPATTTVPAAVPAPASPPMPTTGAAEAPKPVTPVFPVVIHTSDGKILAVIDADGKVTGDKDSLTKFLKEAKGDPTIEELILALLAERMVAK